MRPDSILLTHGVAKQWRLRRQRQEMWFCMLKEFLGHLKGAWLWRRTVYMHIIGNEDPANLNLYTYARASKSWLFALYGQRVAACLVASARRYVT